MTFTEHPLKVNQFRFRSIDNRTHTGEFFFNNGSLSGDELLKQTKQVIFGYEMAEAKILGLALDGGGNNARLLKLLRNGKELDEGQSWLDEDQVSFANPADPTRQVAVFHCTTHNLKGSRNALLNSDSLSKKPSRDFRFGSVKFGWQTIRRTYSRDQRKSVPDTSLRKGPRILTVGIK
jgi:hypothetical protein